MLSFNEEKFVCATSNILTTKKDQITRGDIKGKLETKNTVASVGKAGVGEKI